MELVCIWLDAHLSPSLRPWIESEFGVRCVAVRELGLRESDDGSVFTAARRAGAVLLTKDSDFIELVLSRGSPPAVVRLACGNTSNDALMALLTRRLPEALRLIAGGEIVVEIA